MLNLNISNEAYAIVKTDEISYPRVHYFDHRLEKDLHTTYITEHITETFRLLQQYNPYIQEFHALLSSTDGQYCKPGYPGLYAHGESAWWRVKYKNGMTSQWICAGNVSNEGKYVKDCSDGVRGALTYRWVDKKMLLTPRQYIKEETKRLRLEISNKRKEISDAQKKIEELKQQRAALKNTKTL